MNQKKKWITQRKLICFLLRKRTILHLSQLSDNKRIIIYGNVVIIDLFNSLYEKIYISNIKNQYNKEKVTKNNWNKKPMMHTKPKYKNN